MHFWDNVVTKMLALILERPVARNQWLTLRPPSQMGIHITWCVEIPQDSMARYREMAWPLETQKAASSPDMLG
jgi:hypothetical protein